MKFAMFSPLALTSAIGRSTSLVVQALIGQGHEVVIIRTEHGAFLDRPAHPSAAPVVPWVDHVGVLTAVHAADARIYQIGDNFFYHEGALHWLAQLPGVVCLHDFFVASLFNGWAQGKRDEAIAVLERWYGRHVAGPFFGATNSEEFIEFARHHSPMTEWICAMADAVITHSHWGVPRVAASCPGPVRVVPLAYDAPGARAASPRPGAGDGDNINLLTIGHANPNKRIASVIRAIGSSFMLRDRISYRLCGHIDPQTALELSSLARSHRVSLLISGETDDSALRDAIDSADVVCALRWPSLEAASATAIEGLLYGKLTLVTDIGFYAEIPSDCAVKISPEHEVDQIRRALENACQSPETRHAMARRGQQWASATFSASNYASHLIEVAELAAVASPAIRMVDGLARTLRGWGAPSGLIDVEYFRESLSFFNRQPVGKAP